MKVKSSFFLFILFLFPLCRGISQQAGIDSLKRALKSELPDSIRTNILIQLADLHKSTSVDSALHYIQLAKDRIDTAEVSQLFINYTIALGYIYYTNGDVKKSLAVVDKILKDTDAHLLYNDYADLSFRKALCYYKLAEYDSATEILLNTIDTVNKYNDLKRIAGCYNSLGNIMKLNERKEQALEYYKLAYDMNKEAGANREAYRNLASLATGYSVVHDFDKSIPLFKEIILGSRQYEDPFLEAFACGNLGLNYVDIEELDSAAHYLNLAISMYRKMNNKVRIARTSNQLSRLYLEQQQYDKAVDILLPSLAIAKDIENIELEDAITVNLGRAYEGLKNYKVAYQYARSHDQLRDSILTVEVRRAVNEAQTIHETEKKEAEIDRLALVDELNQERLIKQRYGMGGLTIGLGLLSFLLYRVYGQKSKIESQSAIIEKSLHEKETLLREIHHRVKNNLQVISSLLGLQSRSLEDQAAIDALAQSRARVQSMSLIHQNLYQRDNLTGIHIKDYFEKLSSNLINTYRISEEIKIEADIEDIVIDVDTIIPIGLILNELLTNSLKHAFAKNDGAGTITVALRKIGQQLFLFVSDDGIGIENPSQVLLGEGYGYELITSLVEKLEGTIDVKSIKGTQIEISLSNFKLIDV